MIIVVASFPHTLSRVVCSFIPLHLGFSRSNSSLGFISTSPLNRISGLIFLSLQSSSPPRYIRATGRTTSLASLARQDLHDKMTHFTMLSYSILVLMALLWPISCHPQVNAESSSPTVTSAFTHSSTLTGAPICNSGGGDYRMDPPTAMRLADIFCEELVKPENFPVEGTIILHSSSPPNIPPSDIFIRNVSLISFTGAGFYSTHYPTDLSPEPGSPNYTRLNYLGSLQLAVWTGESHGKPTVSSMCMARRNSASGTIAQELYEALLIGVWFHYPPSLISTSTSIHPCFILSESPAQCSDFPILWHNYQVLTMFLS